MLRGYFGVTGDDSEEAAQRKIAGTLLLLDPALTEMVPLMLDFLGVPDPERPSPQMDAEARQRQLLGLVKRTIQARSRREPAVLFLEDLHWIDGGSAAFVEAAVEAVAGTRSLCLSSFRPEYHAAWMQKSYYQQLPLLPLGPEAIADLLADLLGSDPSLAGLADRIRAHTGGNPFFIEEAVQALVEVGTLAGCRGGYRLATPVERLAVPPAVRAVLAARIDRLPEREKQVLQTAAVIGRAFDEPVLRRVTSLAEDELAVALARLVGAEFLYEEALYPETVYAFKHPLTLEVAYGSQLGERRARVHRAVAEALEAASTEHPGERAALIAQHWEGGGAHGGALACARGRVGMEQPHGRGASPLGQGACACARAPAVRGADRVGGRGLHADAQPRVAARSPGGRGRPALRPRGGDGGAQRRPALPWLAPRSLRHRTRICGGRGGTGHALPRGAPPDDADGGPDPGGVRIGQPHVRTPLPRAPARGFVLRRVRRRRGPRDLQH